jgi:hypothetical protein
MKQITNKMKIVTQHYPVCKAMNSKAKGNNIHEKQVKHKSEKVTITKI